MGNKLHDDDIRIYVTCYCFYYDWSQPSRMFDTHDEPPDCGTEFVVEATLGDWRNGLLDITCPNCGNEWAEWEDVENMELLPELNPNLTMPVFGYGKSEEVG